jgi:hypothetical protein
MPVPSNLTEKPSEAVAVCTDFAGDAVRPHNGVATVAYDRIAHIRGYR